MTPVPLKSRLVSLMARLDKEGKSWAAETIKEAISEIERLGRPPEMDDGTEA